MAEIDTWMPWHIAEYLADTMHLSTLEHGAYLLLLAHGWRNDGMIAVNERVLAGVTRMTVDQWRTIKPTMERFFTSTNHPALGPCWFQKRQVEEIRKAKENKAKAAERTKKATQARWSSVTDTSRTPNGERNGIPREVKVEDSSSPPPENSARVDAPRLQVRSQEAVALASQARMAPGMTQADLDRAQAVAGLYPLRSPKDGRAIRVDLQGVNLLAMKIAGNPDFPWEEAAGLESLNHTPQDFGNWLSSQPDPVMLATRRKQKSAPPPLKPGERPKKTMQQL